MLYNTLRSRVETFLQMNRPVQAVADWNGMVEMAGGAETVRDPVRPMPPLAPTSAVAQDNRKG